MFLLADLCSNEVVNVIRVGLVKLGGAYNLVSVVIRNIGEGYIANSEPRAFLNDAVVGNLSVWSTKFPDVYRKVTSVSKN